MKWQLNTYILFVLWVDSMLIILLYHLLHSWNHHFLSKWQELSSSYSSSLEGSSLNGESLIFNCSHLLLLFLWVEMKAITSFWHTLFAWIPWSWEAIQGGYHHFCILHFFFYCFKLFCNLDLHILQLFSQSHLLI